MKGKKMVKQIIVLGGLMFSVIINIYAADIVSHWSFDEGSGTIIKDSVRNNNGEIQGSARYVDGKIGSALEFDGKTLVKVIDKDESGFSLTSMTLSAWIYIKDYPLPSSGYWAGIIGKNYYAVSTYGLWLTYNKRLCFFAFNPALGKEKEKIQYFSKTPLEKNQWYHVVVTYDNSKVCFYVNGKLDSVYEETRLPEENERNIFIGSIAENFGYFEGIIDEVKIFKGALTETEVEAEYNCKLSK